ncbi:MarR family winged helix-turn-helix transcriptional regulator [Actinomadura rifamycini]|uniref:MarR family winged helix-turn-helix transcriptional regulator n=1 Tax=Actinomadura rifamycini TaxID=31962 RepID=UPI000421EB4D|nr:MarR family transcriptional regulator [Actinomadura rifamycini]
MTHTERPSGPGAATAPASAPGTDPAARAWRNLRLAILERGDRRREATAALGMSFFRVKALCRIAAAPAPMTLRDLAHELVTDRPYATLVVDDLVGRGLAERTVNPGDRRSKLVTATAAGRAAAAEAERVLNTPPPALRDLPPEDLAALDRIAARLAAEL